MRHLRKPRISSILSNWLISPGENVVDCCARILVLAERLDSAGAFEPSLLCTIARIFTLSTEKKFEFWAIEMYRKCMAYVKMICVNDPDTVDTKITYESIIVEAQEEYRSLYHSKQWAPATTIPNLMNPAYLLPTKLKLPKLFSLQLSRLVSVRQPNSSNTSQRIPLDPNATCGKCGKKGHTSSNCTLPDWIFQKPDGDLTNATIKKKGRTYNWCKKCNCYRLHTNEKHDEWKKKKQPKSKRTRRRRRISSNSNNSLPPPEPAANLAAATIRLLHSSS